MANDVSRETVTGKRHAVAEAEPTDRIKRESTEEATALASQKKGRKGQAGTKKKGRKTKKSLDAEAALPKLFDIALPDDEQLARSLEFLHDQRGERKCRLPPLIGELGVERRRRIKEAQEETSRPRAICGQRYPLPCFVC